jgi:dienelactone hydrolase
MRVIRMPDGMRFGLIGERSARPAPALIYPFSFELLQKEPSYAELSRLALKRGIISIILDEPGTGEDARPDEDRANSLKAWRARLDRGEDFTGAFNRYARTVLDYVVKEGYADPNKVAAWGCSRDGYLAFHLAAVEPRIRAIVANSPVTDLLALTEFKGTTHNQEAEALSLAHLAPALAGRAVWIDIGNNDRRVDSDRVVAFSRALVRAASERNQDGAIIPVELLVGPSWHAGGSGHYAVEGFNEFEAEWLFRSLGVR